MENRVCKLRKKLKNVRATLRRMEKRREELERKQRFLLFEISGEMNRG